MIKNRNPTKALLLRWHRYSTPGKLTSFLILFHTNPPRLNAFLRLAVVHSSSSLNNAPSQHQVALLWSLRSLFIHPALVAHPSMSELVFDVAALLSDSISDEVRIHLAKLDAIKATDNARCTFVFGTVAPGDGWLALSKPVSSPALQASSSPQLQPLQPVQTPQPQSQTPSPAALQQI